jgi:cytochrome P450
MFHYDPHSKEVFDDPYPVYQRLRDEAPAYYIEEFNCWFLSRFEDIWQAEQDNESFTVTEGVTSDFVLTTRPEIAPMTDRSPYGRSLSLVDPPLHTRFRTLINGNFMPVMARSLEPFTRKLARSLIDELVDRGRFDVVNDFAMKVSVRIACTIIGIPLDDAPMLVDLVNTYFSRDPNVRGMTEQGAQASLTMSDYLTDFIAARRRSGAKGDSVTDLMLHADFDGRTLTDEDICGHLLVLLIGGTETLPKVVSSCSYRLYQNPAQRAELAADPSLLRAAFWEALRFDMPTQMLGRCVVRDTEIQGEKLRVGQYAMFLFAAANRDEREFPEPDRFDIHRNAPRILTFGHGTHRCLGSHIAQMEGRVMIGELLARIPEYEVVEDEIVRLRSEFFRGFGALPIQFTAP